MKTADVIICGAGIIGCAAAYYTAKKGKSVIVIDADEIIGNGGSSRNGGGVRQSGRDPRELPLAMYGVKNIWPTLSEELGVDVEYHQDGNLRLGRNDRHQKILEGLTERAVAVGLDVKMIDGDEVRSINPWLAPDVTCASWCPTDGHANPLKATLAFFKAARRLGVTFYSGEKVLSLKKEKGVLRYVVTDHDTYSAEKVIVACGYESRAILQTVGIDVPMTKDLIECLVTEAEPPMFKQMLGTADADFYGHQTDHGSFVFGGASGYEAQNLDFGCMTTHSTTAPAICRGILKWIPRLREAMIVRTWSGYEDVCADGVPVIDAIDEVPGLIVACAFTGHGFGISPVVGQLLSQLACDEETMLDLSELRYDRFKACV